MEVEIILLSRSKNMVFFFSSLWYILQTLLLSFTLFILKWYHFLFFRFTSFALYFPLFILKWYRSHLFLLFSFFLGTLDLIYILLYLRWSAYTAFVREIVNDVWEIVNDVSFNHFLHLKEFISLNTCEVFICILLWSLLYS